MSLPRYPEYRDSGVEWLGNVPAHWQVDELRRRATLNPSKSEIGDGIIDGLASFVPMEAVGEHGELDLSRTRPITDVSNGYTYFREGDVAFAKITPCFENGKGARMVGLHGGLGFGTTELTVVRPQPKLLDGRYLDWVIRSLPFRQRGEAAMYGAGGQKRVPDEFVREFLFAWPRIEEQSAIASFLDRETAKIDALIAEQEKLLALLAEKRQATISHAVTRGLDPNAPVKDSGIPWLGEVPAHWRVSCVRNVCESINTGPFGTALGNEDYVEGGVPVINPSHIVDSRISPDPRVSVSHETAERLEYWALRRQDIVAARRGELGRAAVVGAENEGWICGTGSLRLRILPSLATPEFIHAVLQSSPARDWLNLQSVGSTMANLNEQILGRLPIVVPPTTDEQDAVITALHSSIDGLERAVTEVDEATRLLLERRSALIAAAVTGQRDVRGLVEAQAA